MGISMFIALGGIGSTIFLSYLTGHPLRKLTKDPAQVLHFQVYIGWLSNLSVWLWIIAATFCLFGSEILRRQGNTPTSAHFMRISGLLNLFLAFDDMFLLHDRVFPQFLHLPEKFFYIAYILIILIYLAYFLPQILKHEDLLLLIAVVSLGLSRRMFVAIPILEQYSTPPDMMKFVGIAFWVVFYYRAAFQEITASFLPQKG